MHSQKVIANPLASITLCKWFSGAISGQVFGVIGLDNMLPFTITPTSGRGFYGDFLGK
jgi:hypothetical protein